VTILFGPKRDEIGGGWNKLNIEDVLFPKYTVIRTLK
jgi:hypothetical protein